MDGRQGGFGGYPPVVFCPESQKFRIDDTGLVYRTPFDETNTGVKGGKSLSWDGR